MMRGTPRPIELGDRTSSVLVSSPPPTSPKARSMMRGCTDTGDLNDAQYSRPLPWIGLYIAAASLICGAAMAFDAYHGFRRRQHWFPSRLFSINATTLTLLGIATKLPVDLNTSMPRATDQLTKLSGTVLVCTAMGNFMPSLGAMDGSDNLSNVVALGILAVTVVVNVAIQMGTGVIYVFIPEHAIIMLLMMVLLVLLASSALTALTTKELLEKKYDSQYSKIAEGDDAESSGNCISLEKLKICVKKFWLMAHTCSPQYVLGRSATCTASGAFCLVAAGILVQAVVRGLVKGSHMVFCNGSSDYEWSCEVVLVAQLIAVLVGTIGPSYRWFNAVSFRSTDDGRKWSCRDEFKVEAYWVQRLNEWKEAPLTFHLSSRRRRKKVHELKDTAMAVLMMLQAGVVRISKLARLASILPVSWISKSRRLVRQLESKKSSVHAEDEDLKDYVLHLEGEEDLVTLITKSERRDTDKWIAKGRKKQPKDLLELIQDHSSIAEGFNGVHAFDRGTSVVPSLLNHDEERGSTAAPSSLITEEARGSTAAPSSITEEGQGSTAASSSSPIEEPPHCWALPVVTLMSIVIALPLPRADRATVDSLRSAVSEGLRYVRLIEKHLDARGLMNMREAADKIWTSLDLYDKWFDVDLYKVRSGRYGGKCVAEALRDRAIVIVQDYQGKQGDPDPLEWSAKLLAANCMYRVCATLLHDYDTQIHNTDEDLFGWCRSRISDILGACLTNLPRAIYMECVCSRVEKREEDVRGAAFLLGEAEQILELLHNPEVAGSFPKKRQYVSNWGEERYNNNNP